MKTKREIVKWLENQRSRAVCEARERAKEKQDICNSLREEKLLVDYTVDKIMGKYKEAMTILIAWFRIVDEMDEKPHVGECYYNGLYTTLDVDPASIKREMLNHLQRSDAMDKIQSEKERTISNIQRNYANLIANVQMLKSNKEAIAYLRKIGFDVQELLEDKDCTALSVPVDTAYLFIKKEENHE